MSGAELAQKAGISRSLVSQVEQNAANPSIETLRRIAIALGVPIARLFEEQHDAPNGIVVRKDQRKRLRVPESNLLYELLSPDLDRQIEFVWIEVKPGKQTLPTPAFVHEGEECAVVIKGQLHVRIGDDEYVLNEGDAICFDSGLPHSIANLSSEKVILISAITPPLF